MTLQLDPPIPLETPLGYGVARIYHTENDYNDQWVVFLHCGVIWTFDNADVRTCESLTDGRLKPSMQQWDGKGSPVDYMRKYYRRDSTNAQDQEVRVEAGHAGSS